MDVQTREKIKTCLFAISSLMISCNGSAFNFLLLSKLIKLCLFPVYNKENGCVFQMNLTGIFSLNGTGLNFTLVIRMHDHYKKQKKQQKKNLRCTYHTNHN